MKVHGISSKNQYNKKGSKDIFEIDENGKKNQVTFMDDCKIPKLTDYKTVMRFVNSVDIGELHDIRRAKKTKFDKRVYVCPIVCTYGGSSGDFQSWESKNRVEIVNSVAKFENKLTQKQLAASTKVKEFISENSQDSKKTQFELRRWYTRCRILLISKL